MNKLYEELIAGYLDGSLTQEEDQMLQQLIESGEIDLIDIETMRQLHDQLDMIAVPQPSEKMSQNFYEMLEKEQYKTNSESGLAGRVVQWVNGQLNKMTIAKLGYASMLIIIGVFIGSNLNSSSNEIEELTGEMQNLREMMMVSMLQGPSATDRLRAVTISSQLPQADNKAIRALLFTLNNDESVNVRIQAVEALSRWADHETVREGLVKAISNQDDEMVIITLADTMVELGLNQSAGEFEKIIQEKELNELTKTKLENSIAVLM